MAGKAKPVVGVIGNASVVNDRHNVQLVGQRNMRAIAEVAGALPLMFAGTPDITDVDALLGAVDGILLTGARANVHPTCFGVEPDPRHEPYDHHRDAMALSLIKACVERGIPLFGICRGLQEVNVALGGTLHQLVHEVEGRRDHRSPKSSDTDVNYGPAHDIEIVEGGLLHRLVGERRVQVNSLHAQGVDRLAPRARLEAVAEDGQVEAFSVPDAPAFALALQWHPEHRALENPVSMKLFDAFAAACRSRAVARRAPPLRAAAE